MSKKNEAVEFFNDIPNDFLRKNTGISRYTDFESYIKTYDDEDWKILKQELIDNPTSSLKEIIDSMWMNYDNDIKLGEVYYHSSGFDEYVDCLTQWGKKSGLSEEKIKELCDDFSAYVQNEWEKQHKFPLLSLCSDYEYLKENLSEPALNELEKIIDAYGEGKIDIEIVRDEKDEIKFEESFNLIVNDMDYKKSGFEDIALKWYEGFEDTGFFVECFSEIESNSYQFTVDYSENGVQKSFEIGIAAKEKPDSVWLAQKISDYFSALCSGSVEEAINSVEGIDLLIENGKGEYVDSDEIYGDDLKALFEHLKNDKPRLDAVISAAAEQRQDKITDKEAPGVEQER